MNKINNGVIMQIVTEALLDLGQNKSGDINESQLVLLDVKKENKAQYKTLSFGKELSDARAELFVLLAGVQETEIQERIIENYKALQKYRAEQQPVEHERLKNPITKEQSSVTIFCDGGCTPNPGKAGSGVAIYKNDKLSELWYGLYESMGTNNTAELGALYESLLIAQKEAKNGNRVSVKCDSMYSINCITKWAISWERKGWTKKGGEIKNLEIIKRSYALYNSIKKDVKLTHIKAHAGFEGNELADRMTMYAIKKKSDSFVKYSDAINVDKILKMKAG
jgi:ribonuclease HI